MFSFGRDIAHPTGIRQLNVAPYQGACQLGAAQYGLRSAPDGHDVLVEEEGEAGEEVPQTEEEDGLGAEHPEVGRRVVVGPAGRDPPRRRRPLDQLC